MAQTTCSISVTSSAVDLQFSQLLFAHDEAVAAAVASALAGADVQLVPVVPISDAVDRHQPAEFAGKQGDEPINIQSRLQGGVDAQHCTQAKRVGFGKVRCRKKSDFHSVRGHLSQMKAAIL